MEEENKEVTEETKEPNETLENEQSDEPIKEENFELSSEEIQKNNKKSNVLLIAFLCVSVIIIIALLCLLLLGRGNNTNTNGSGNETGNTNNDNVNEDGTINENKVKEKINHFVEVGSYISTMGSDTFGIFSNGVSELTREQKFMMTYVSTVYIGKKNKKLDSIPDKYKNNEKWSMVTNVDELLMSDFNEEYKNLFNEEIGEYTEKDIQGCPFGFFMDKDEGKIYLSHECGGTVEGKTTVEIKKTNSDDKYNYVYQKVSTDESTYEIEWKFDKKGNFISTTKNNPQTEEISVESPEVKKAMDGFSKIYITDARFDDDNYNIKNLTVSEIIETLGKLALEESKNSETKIINTCEEEGYYISIAQINELLSGILEKEITADFLESNKNESGYISGVYDYNMKIIDNQYYLNAPCESHDYNNIVDHKIIRAEKTEEYLYVYEKRGFYEIGDEINVDGDAYDFYINYYKDKDMKEFVEKVVGDMVPSLGSTYYTQKKDLTWDKYNTYKYTFKIKDGNYYFIKHELVMNS